MFNISSGCNLTFINITFINGNSDYGGAINTAGGILNIENCKFENNTATIHGGGIHSSIGGISSVSVSKSTFINNTANNGGAIYNSGTGSTGSGSAVFCVFLGNSKNIYNNIVGGFVADNCFWGTNNQTEIINSGKGVNIGNYYMIVLNRTGGEYYGDKFNISYKLVNNKRYY